MLLVSEKLLRDFSVPLTAQRRDFVHQRVCLPTAWCWADGVLCPISFFSPTKQCCNSCENETETVNFRGPDGGNNYPEKPLLKLRSWAELQGSKHPQTKVRNGTEPLTVAWTWLVLLQLKQRLNVLENLSFKILLHVCPLTCSRTTRTRQFTRRSAVAAWKWEAHAFVLWNGKTYCSIDRCRFQAVKSATAYGPSTDCFTRMDAAGRLSNSHFPVARKWPLVLSCIVPPCPPFCLLS